MQESTKIAVIGLGYVGLPIAIAFSKKYDVIGYDKNADRIASLACGNILSTDLSAQDLKSKKIKLSNNPDDLAEANFYIVAVPTPITDSKQPDLSLLLQASELVGRYLKPNDTVVYESTVYPGVTEEACIPVLAKTSKLRYQTDFYVGYSPERINPGDKEHRFETITKVVAANDNATLRYIAKVYGSVIYAEIYCAPNIKTAEAAKVIENTQRDLNVALMNELAVIFNRMGIDTLDVINTAATKWNFLPFKPGLVGGHCIGVDPYYLTYQAQRYGYNPEVILAGRHINDDMGRFIASQTIKQMLKANYPVKNAVVGILGITFKENCPDVRNSKVIDIINELKEYGVKCVVHDPVADHDATKQLYGITLQPWEAISNIDTLIIAVPHQQFYKYSIAELHDCLKQETSEVCPQAEPALTSLEASSAQAPCASKTVNGGNFNSSEPSFSKYNSLIIDVKGMLDRAACSAAGIRVWRL